MEPFPPPDSIGRDGLFLDVITGWWTEAFARPYIFVNVARMRVDELHGFDLSPPEARRLQEELASRVVAGPALDLAGVRYVAGADVSTQNDMAYATVVVLKFPGLSRRSARLRGAAPVSIRTWTPFVQGGAFGGRGLAEGRDRGGLPHSGCPGARASPPHGPGLAPRDLS